MAKGSNQKLKLLYLCKIFNELTDEYHGLSTQELIAHLNKYGVNADRKTIYQDLEELRHFGLDIISVQKGHIVYYQLASREFELPELKLLVDSVQSAKFITERKSRELIKKLERLISSHEAKQLQRQVIISGRVKTMNESIYYSVDKIHTAINNNVTIRFQYYQWNINKEAELRHGGAWYDISPWALLWDDEYYYLIGYDAESDKIKHYRVDKMLHISPTEKKRKGKELFSKIDIPSYSKGLFGMFGGDEITVSLLCDNSIVGVIIDRFGKDIPINVIDENHFSTFVNVSASRQFIGWVIGLGDRIKIIGPQSVVDAIRGETRRLMKQYDLN